MLSGTDVWFTRDQKRVYKVTQTVDTNDPSGMTVWGIFKGQGGLPCAMLVKGWRKHLEMHGTVVDMEDGETYRQWRRRAEAGWGLVEWIAETCRFRNSEGRSVPVPALKPSADVGLALTFEL